MNRACRGWPMGLSVWEKEEVEVKVEVGQNVGREGFPTTWPMSEPRFVGLRDLSD